MQRFSVCLVGNLVMYVWILCRRVGAVVVSKNLTGVVNIRWKNSWKIQQR